MHQIVLSFDNKVRSFGIGALAAFLLLGGAGCLLEGAEGEGDITQVSSAVTVPGPNGHTYLFFNNESKTFQEAETFCASVFPMGTYHLADIRDANEDAWLLDQERRVFGGGTWWFGYSDKGIEGYWVWSAPRGGPHYVNWHAGEPNNQNDEDCGMHNAFTDGKWNDANCNSRLRVVCEDQVDTFVPFAYNASNTASATTNYVQWAVPIVAGASATIGTCGNGGTGLLNTYLRLFNPWNNAQVASNDDFPNFPCVTATQTNPTLSLFSYAPGQTTGTFIIHAGCANATACGGNVAITRP